MRDVTVVGGGPAGVGAAVAALRAGARVTVVDGSPRLGGQYFRQTAEGLAGRPGPTVRGWQGFLRALGILEGHRACTILTSASVWALEREDSPVPAVRVVRGEADGDHREHLTLRPDRLVLAPGAHDRVVPFPGWDLPGVYTAGGAQALAKGEGVAVGRRVLLSGTGPFLLPVAESLAQHGATVVGVLEASRPARIAAGWLGSARGLLHGTGANKAGELARYAAGQLRNAIPYRMGRGVVAAHGDGRVRSATVSALAPDWTPLPGTEERVEVDAVCVGHGFEPRLELPLAAGCDIGPHRTVIVDDDQRTSVAGVFAAGEITGVGGADLAEAEGLVAGWQAARSAPGALRRTRRARRRHRELAARMHRAHPIGANWPAWLTPETLVCRCEEVTAGELASVRGRTATQSLRSLKLTTRAGLGPCQGRVCGAAVAELTRRHVPGGASGASPPTMDARPVAVPLRLGELATAETTGPTGPPPETRGGPT